MSSRAGDPRPDPREKLLGVCDALRKELKELNRRSARASPVVQGFLGNNVGRRYRCLNNFRSGGNINK